VFSYVVLGAGFFTTQKAQETVYKGVEQSTANILLKGSVYGTAASTVSGIDSINLTIGLAPGAPPMDVSKITIAYSNATVQPVIMTYTGTAGTAPAVGTFYASAASIASDSQVNIWFQLPAPAPKSTVMSIEIRPAGGGAVIPFTKTVPGNVDTVNILR
jgi:flagellin FlaB